MLKNKINKLKSRICPFCEKRVDNNFASHLKNVHGEEKFRKLIIEIKKDGLSDPDIGKIFNITFRELEKIITQEMGINISIVKRKKIKSFYPKKFDLEKTTVWSFKSRGNWATHDGRYRGNWSPYIPRNIILKYTKPGDVILDYFVGGGTTAIEAKLLGRRCIGIDINPAAVKLARENLKFDVPLEILGENRIYEPEIYIGDARSLKNIKDESIDLICAHPPYAGIISYSMKIEGDLSQLSMEEYFKEMRRVAKESFRVLKPGKYCVILIGDSRKNKRVVPIGFNVIRIFLETGFKLKELIIKRQHNCKTTGFWFERSLKYNFLLLAHEYLPVFFKPEREERIKEKKILYYSSPKLKFSRKKINVPETTTVWIFKERNWFNHAVSNLLIRFKIKNYVILDKEYKKIPRKELAVFPVLSLKDYEKFKEKLCKHEDMFYKFDYLAFICSDIRLPDHTIFPVAVKLEENLKTLKDFKLKEIVVISLEGDGNKDKNGEDLLITHKYLLIYDKK